MPFKQGNKQGKGRPPGSLNVVGQEEKQILGAFFSKEFKKLANSFENSEMSEYQKWQVLLKLSDFIIPRLRSQEMSIDMNYTDEDIDRIATQVGIKHWEHVIKENNGEIKLK